MDRQSDKITALYCRIDKPFDIGADSTAAHAQIDRLTQYAKEHNLKTPKFFCDWGYSGTTSDRPEYQRMLQEVVSGNVANLVVLNLSRLNRDTEDAWKLIGDTFPHYGVAFHSVQDGSGIDETLNKFSLIRQELETAYRRSQERGRE